MTLDFDKNWRFRLEEPTLRPFVLVPQKNGEAKGYAADRFNDTDWKRVDLPHDWVYALPMDREYGLSHGHYMTTTVDMMNTDPTVKPENPGSPVGWYRKRFRVPAEATDQLVYLTFDGVFRDSTVWVNGALMGRHMSGYTGFTYEISDNLRFGGENSIAVRVDAGQTEGWWYEGAGIYRHVHLEYRHRISFVNESLFIRSETDGTVKASCEVTNQTDTAISGTVIFEADGVKAEVPVSIPAFRTASAEGILRLENPTLWDVDNPHRYTMTARLSVDGKVTDEREQAFGIRSIRFDPDHGFFLNGKRVQLQGVCVHQDFACVGVALPDDIHEYKIRRLKEMGVNAYRTSHNAPAPELVEACDRLGMLLMDENRMFGSSPEALEQLTALVRRDRNSPSVILWSLGNEEHSVQNNDRGRRIAQSMIRAVKALDDTRPITYGGNNNGIWEGVNAQMEVRGFNYLHICPDDYLEKYHADHPDQPLVGSEEASSYYNRGGVTTDLENRIVGGYDESTAPWGSTAEGWLKYYRNHPYIAGGFLWTGFDYSGEPSPFMMNSVTSFGIIDLCGYPKDVYYYYQAWWTKQDVLYLFPDWNRKPGESVRAVVYTNAEEAELFLNGRSLGRKTVEYLGHLEWTVPFEPGCLEAAAYRGGTEVKRFARHTVGTPHHIRLRIDNAPLTGTTVLATAEICDADGYTVPYADNAVRFSVRGGRILGVGNGNPSSYEKNQFEPTAKVRAIDGWVREDGSAYDVNTPSDSALFYYGVEREIQRSENKPPFCEAVRLINRGKKAPDVPTVYEAAFEDEGGEAMLTFRRLEANSTELLLNGEVLDKLALNGFPQSYNVTLKPGRNTLTVRMSAPGGLAAIREGVCLTRWEEPAWSRKAFHGLCMAMVQKDGALTVTAEADGLLADSLMLE